MARIRKININTNIQTIFYGNRSHMYLSVLLYVKNKLLLDVKFVVKTTELNE